MIRDFDQLIAPIVVLTLVWIFCLVRLAVPLMIGYPILSRM